MDKKLQHLADQLTEGFNSGKLHEKFGINAIPDKIADSKGLGTFMGPLNEKFQILLDPEKAKLLFDEEVLKKHQKK